MTDVESSSKMNSSKEVRSTPVEVSRKNEATFAPYKLSVIVNRAENLPVADITTSDPYVIVSLGDKTIGRTKTVYKNHLTPEWDEFFNVKLLHTKAILLFSIFDEDRGKDDDILGTVSIDLSKLVLGVSIQQTYDVVNAVGFEKAKAKLHLTLVLGRNDSVIQIVKDSEGESAKIETDVFTQDDLIAIQHELALISTSECVQNELCNFAADGRTSYLSKGLVKDLLCDIHSMTTPVHKDSVYHSDAFNNNIDHLYRRDQLKLVNASEFGLNTKQCIRHSPQMQHSLQLNFNAHNSHFIILQLPNRFAMWSWVRWLRTCYDVWSEDLNPTDVPRWASSGSHTSVTPLSIILSNGHSYTGKCTITFKHPFEIRVNDDIIKIKPLVSLLISQDSTVPKAYMIDIKVISYEVHGTHVTDVVTSSVHAPDLLDDVNDDDDENPYHPTQRGETTEADLAIGKGKLLMSLGKGMKGAVKGTIKGITYVGMGTVNAGSTVVVGAKDVVVGTVVGATGAAVHTTRTLVSGDAMKMKDALSDAVVGVGKGIEGIASHITSAPGNIFGKTNSFVVLKSALFTRKFTRHNIDSLQFYLDISEENLESRSARTIEENMENERDLVRRKSTLQAVQEVTENRNHFPLFDQSNTCIDIVMFQGVDGNETVVGAKHIPIRKLLNKTKKSTGSVRSGLLNALKNGETKVPLESVLTLDSNLGLSITLIEGKDLVIPSSTIGGLAGESGIMYAKCKLVDEMGRSGTTSAFGSKSQTVTACVNPNWSECNFILKANEQHYISCEYVRVELYVEFLVSTGAESIGAIFIPLDYFQAKSKVLTFPVVKYARTTSAPAAIFTALANTVGGHGTAGSADGLGTLTVKINRIDEETNSKCTIKLRSSLIECSPFNSLWYGECLLAGNLEADSIEKYLEKYMVTASFDGLMLIDNNGLVEKVDTRGRPADSNKHDTSKHSPKLMSPGHSTATTTPAPSTPVTPLPSASLAAAAAVFAGGSLRSNVTERATTIIDPSLMEMQIEVFQNQRRQLLPPFDWSTSAITRPDYSDISYQIPYKFATLNAAKPPVGFEWVGDWEIDKNYTKCDKNGWSYAISFGRLLSNQKAGKSYDKPANTHVRRRKWVRMARMIAEEPPETKVESRFEGNQRFESSRPTESWMRPTFDAHSFARGNDTDFSALHLPAPSNVPSAVGSIASETPRSHHLSINSHMTTVDQSNWRKDAFLTASNSSNVNNIIQLCQERRDPHSHVMIKWTSIYSATVVTPSILSIHFTVNRYFGEENSNFYSPRFQPVDIEMFVSNCSALELKGLIDERIWFFQYRADIKNLILNPVEISNASVKSNGHNGREDEDVTECTEVPETEELSVGSEIVADLDDTSIALESRIRHLDHLYAKNRDHTLMQEKAVIVRRDCRLRLYLAALLGAGLGANHSYKVEDVHKIMESDFKKMLHINQDNDVSTANNRIEYLLDTAEKRIRDTALCGWNHRGGALEKCLEVFTNGYFIEIVGLLGRFFDGTGHVKGLHSKVELITTYMKHNDRLDFIIESALRPYRLRAVPAPKLNIFLDFEVLASWYTSVLLFEMRGRVDDVLKVWKDPSKDVSGMSSCYKFPLPWVPQRLDNDGIFLTAIPEDLVEILMTYLSHARLKKSNVASSFHERIGMLDGTVCLSFASAFLYLTEEYQNAMISKDYQTMGEEELSEYFTWMSSIANDARRVRRIELLSAVESKDASSFEVHPETQKKVTDLVTNTYFSYDKVMMKAVDHISCILMMYLFHDTFHYLDKTFFLIWKDNVDKNDLLASGNNSSENLVKKSAGHLGEDNEAEPEKIEPKDNDFLIPKMMSEFSDHLEDKMDYIEPLCFYKLVSICADKFVIFYMTFLREARQAGELYAHDSKYTKQIAKDIQTMKDCFELIASHPSIVQYYTEIVNKFLIIDYCHVLLSCTLMSPECDEALESLIQIAKDHHSRDFSIAVLIETCMGLRGLKKFVVKPVTSSLTSAVRTTSTVTPTVGALTPSKHGTTPPTAGSTTTTPSPVKRGSIFSFLHIGGPHHDAQQHGSHLPPVHPPVPTKTFDIDNEADGGSDNDELENDEDDEVLREGKRLQEESYTTFIEERIAYIHSLHENHNKSFKSNTSDNLISIPPECRVFDSESDCSRYSLKAQLFQSAIPAAKRDLYATSKNGPSHRNSITTKNILSGFSSFFSSSSSLGSGGRLSSIDVTERKSQHSVVPSHSHHHGRRLSDASKFSPKGSAFVGDKSTSDTETDVNPTDCVKTIAFQMLITNIQFNHLFYLEMFAALKPYVVIKLGEYSYKTAVREGDSNPTWKLECPIELPVYNATNQRSFHKDLSSKSGASGEDDVSDVNSPSTSMNELVISLFYQGFFNDQYIGSIVIPFPSFAPLKFEEKHFILTDFSQNQRAVQAASRATAEGRSLPTLTLSIV